MKKHNQSPVVKTVKDSIANFTNPLSQLKEPFAKRTSMRPGKRRAIHLQHLNGLAKMQPLVLI